MERKIEEGIILEEYSHEIDRTIVASVRERAAERDANMWFFICAVLVVILATKMYVVSYKEKEREVVAVSERFVPAERIVPKKRNREAQAIADYLERWLPTAQSEAKKYSLPVSILLAQGILESNSGQSRLVQKHNNHFGVTNSKGEYAHYGTAWESWRHHSEILNNAPYKSLRGMAYDDYAAGLERLGYAEDDAYAEKLIAIIKYWELEGYD